MHDEDVRFDSADELHERRRLRLALGVAVAFHLALLLVPHPGGGEIAAAEEAPRSLFVVRPVRFRPPRPPAERPPEEERLRVPIPDPTPDDPEPLREVALLDEPAPAPLGDWIVDVPDPPPPEEEEVSGPLVLGGAIARPRAIDAPPPLYTEAARRVRVQGVVVLRVVLDARGRIGDVEVLAGLPFGLTESAVDAVRRWRYEPATLHDRPVPVLMTISVRFELR